MWKLGIDVGHLPLLLSIPPPWKRSLLITLELANLAHLAGQQAPGIHLSPHSKFWDYRHSLTFLAFFCGHWRIELRFNSTIDGTIRVLLDPSQGQDKGGNLSYV